jgi:hypothetical protein
MSNFKFSNEHSQLLWAEEQLRLLWEFLEMENLDEEADAYVKEQLDIIDYADERT